MNTTLLTILISVLATALIYYIFIYKGIDKQPKLLGKIIYLGIFFFITFSITKCAFKKPQNIVSQRPVSTTVISIDSETETHKYKASKTEFIGADTAYYHCYNVFYNNTGRNLISYRVDYCVDGTVTKVLETVAAPNHYFDYFPSKFFETPPTSITIEVPAVHSRYGRTAVKHYKKSLYFVDYEDNVSLY